MKLQLKKAAVNVTLYVFIQDSSSSTGGGLTGLTFESASLVASFVRPLAARAALSLITQTVTGAHADGGFVEVDSANMPGVYRLDLSDAVCATGVDTTIIMLKGATNMAPVLLEIQLTGFDLNTASVPQGADNNTILSSLTIADGSVKADLTHIHGNALSETTDGWLAAAFKKLFDVETPALVASTAMKGTDYAALASVLGSAVRADISADLAAVKAETALIVEDTGTTLPARFTGVEGATFATGTDSLEAIRNRGDAAWTTGAGGDATEAKQNTIIATLGTVPALDGAAQTVGAAIGKLADDNGGADYDAGTDSQEKIKNAVDAISITGGGTPQIK